MTAQAPAGRGIAPWPAFASASDLAARLAERPPIGLDWRHAALLVPAPALLPWRLPRDVGGDFRLPGHLRLAGGALRGAGRLVGAQVSPMRPAGARVAVHRPRSGDPADRGIPERSTDQDPLT